MYKQTQYIGPELRWGIACELGIICTWQGKVKQNGKWPALVRGSPLQNKNSK